MVRKTEASLAGPLGFHEVRTITMAPKRPSPIHYSQASSFSDDEMQQEEAAGLKPNAQLDDTDSSDDSLPPPSKVTISKTVTVMRKPESSGWNDSDHIRTAAKIENSKSATLVKKSGDKRKAGKKAGLKDVKKRMTSESKKSESNVTECNDSRTHGKMAFTEETEVGLLKAMTCGIMKNKMMDYEHQRVLGLIEKSKRVEMVKKWENLLKDEAELKLKLLELERQQKQLILDALNDSTESTW